MKPADELARDDAMAQQALKGARGQNPDLEMDEAQAVATLRTMRLPPERQRRRCLSCWQWSPPMSARCLHCDKRLIQVKDA